MVFLVCIREINMYLLVCFMQTREKKKRCSSHTNVSILCAGARRGMDIASLELEIYMSPKELSRFKNFVTTSCKRLITSDGHRVRNEILQDFISDFDKLCFKVHPMTGKEKLQNQCNLEMISSSGIKLLTDATVSSPEKIVKPLSGSKGKACVSSCKGKGVLQAGIVKQLNDRLMILEEETETMKKDIFGALEERRSLVKEIYEQFQILQRCLGLRNQVRGETSADDTSIANSSKVKSFRCGSICPNE